MGNAMKDDHPYLAGMYLLPQNYLAAISLLRSGDGPTEPRADLLLRKELADEYGLRCVQEWGPSPPN